MKAALHALAQARRLSDSALLQKLVELALIQHAGVSETQLATPLAQVPRGARLYVRLRAEDHLLLRERAKGRGLAAATYASMVLRAHLRALAPLPDRELAELRKAVGALSAVGRNLNQIARHANQSDNAEGPSASDLRAILRALEGLRDHVKALFRANVRSWESGRAEADR